MGVFFWFLAPFAISQCRRRLVSLEAALLPHVCIFVLLYSPAVPLSLPPRRAPLLGMNCDVQNKV